MARYYLVRDTRPHGVEYLVFVVEDPRLDGYRGPLEEGVTLDSDGVDVFTARETEPAPDICMGRDRTDRDHYRMFRTLVARHAADFEPISGVPVVLSRWRSHLYNTGRAGVRWHSSGQRDAG
jgi:hypothetical protein